MKKNHPDCRTKKAQTVIEYTLLLAVFISIVMAMSTMIRRAGEGMVKVVADHVGSQADSEGMGNEYGHLINSRSYVRSESDKTVRERLGATEYGYDNDYTQASSIVTMNQGFVETPSDKKCEEGECIQ